MKNREDKQNMQNKVVDLNRNISIINCQRSKYITKWLRSSEWIYKTTKNKNGPTICCLQETPFKYNDIGSLRVKQWIKIHHANTDQRKAGESIDSLHYQTMSTWKQTQLPGINRVSQFTRKIQQF